jgi:hypothetical protein
MKYAIQVEYVKREVATIIVEAPDVEKAHSLALDEAKFTHDAIGGVWDTDEEYFNVLEETG